MGLLILSPERFSAFLILYLPAYLKNWYTLENPICVGGSRLGCLCIFYNFFSSVVVMGRTGVCSFLP